LLHTAIGVALLSGGINALNQYWERDLDALMRRTELRPLPAGKLPPSGALIFGAVSRWSPKPISRGFSSSDGFLGIDRAGELPVPLHASQNSLRIGVRSSELFPALCLRCSAGRRLAMRSESRPQRSSDNVPVAVPHFHAIATIYREDYNPRWNPHAPGD